MKVTSELTGKGNLLDVMLKSALEMDDVWCPDIHVDGRPCDKEHSNSNHLWLTLY